jgi:hypothetical protein
MARHQAIAAAGATIAAALQARFPRAAFGNAALDVAMRQLPEIQTAMATPPAIALCLWRISPNPNRPPSPRIMGDGRRFRASLAVDLHYLMIPYGQTPEAQQRLLGWSLRAMEDLGPLVAAQLNNVLAEDDVFAADETAELVMDPLPVADHLALWDRIRMLPPSANYVLRRLLIDSEDMLDSNPAVVERRFRLGVPGTASAGAS